MSESILRKTLGCCIPIMAVLCFCTCSSLTWLGGVLPNYSDGQRAGTLIKMSNRGVFWQSYEGEIVLNEFNIGGNGSNLLQFSSLDSEVSDQAKRLMGKRVLVKYHEYLIRPISQSTNYTVTEIVELK